MSPNVNCTFLLPLPLKLADKAVVLNYSDITMTSLYPFSVQVDWRVEIEVHLSKIRQEGLVPPQPDTQLVQKREEELK